MNRSSLNLSAEAEGYRQMPNSRQSSFMSTAPTSAISTGVTRPTSRLNASTIADRSGNMLYDPSRESFDTNRYMETEADRGDETRWGGSEGNDYPEYAQPGRAR